MKSYLFLIKSRMLSKKWLLLIVSWHIVRIKKIFCIQFKRNSNVASNAKIDIVIPTISKDFDILSEVIAGIKKNISHPINKIYIVSKDTADINSFCINNGCIFIDEIKVLGYGKNKITYCVNGVDRSGWMYQQLLKLSGDEFVEMDNYFVIDSDTVLINPHTFIEKEKFVFLQSEEWHEPYFKVFKKIFGYDAPTLLSFTSHMMIFNKKMLKEMKEEMKTKHNKEWGEVYAGTANKTEASCVSDYDTYANWVLYNYPEKTKGVIFYNKGLARNHFDTLTALEKKYSNKYNSLSFHSYIKINI
jgi:hypothetical protein